MIYVPNDTNYDSCYVVRDKDTIRAYSSIPTQNSNVPYKDYYVNSHYMFSYGSQNFSQYSIIPTCESSSNITSNVYYRNDLADILICFFIIVVVCFYFPFKIFSRFFGRWLQW